LVKADRGLLGVASILDVAAMVRRSYEQPIGVFSAPTASIPDLASMVRRSCDLLIGLFA
jgi:hypothetical protein